MRENNADQTHTEYGNVRISVESATNLATRLGSEPPRKQSHFASVERDQPLYKLMEQKQKKKEDTALEKRKLKLAQLRELKRPVDREAIDDH